MSARVAMCVAPYGTGEQVWERSGTGRFSRYYAEVALSDGRKQNFVVDPSTDSRTGNQLTRHVGLYFRSCNVKKVNVVPVLDLAPRHEGARGSQHMASCVLTYDNRCK
jgi:hypothetical protein